jgi:hypothetical protein
MNNRLSMSVNLTKHENAVPVTADQRVQKGWFDVLHDPIEQEIHPIVLEMPGISELGKQCQHARVTDMEAVFCLSRPTEEVKRLTY